MASQTWGRPLPDIFLSYNREDQPRAKLFAEAFEAAAFDVWWDATLKSGEAYDEVTETALRTAKAVVVLWSPRSVVSRWVRAEATLADRNKTLVPCTIEPCERPIMFELTQTAELSHWQGDATDKAWQAFLGDVRRFVGKEATPVAEPVAARLPLPSKPSIAVMPFANLSGDPGQDYFADGMVDEITNALSRFKSLFVIASASTLSFRGKAVSPQEVGRQVGVRYVLEGSVRKADNRVRINVKLTDAEHGAQMWSDRFDDTLADVFALQDRVALSVAGVIEPAVNQAEIRRALQRPTDSLGGYDLYLQALVHFRAQGRDGTLRALDLLQRALDLDPDYGAALGVAAGCYSRIASRGWSDDAPAERDKGLELARRALRASGDDPEVLVRAASVLSQDSDEDVSALFDRAIALNPGSSAAWLLLSDHEMRTGNADLSAEHIETSIRLDPFSPIRSVQLSMLGTARFFQGRFAEALAKLREAAQLHPTNPYVHIMMAACHGRLAEPELARQSLARYKALVPSSVLTGEAIQDQIARNFRNPGHRRLFLDGIAPAAEKGPDGAVS